LAFRISRELIDRKLAGQERVANDSLKDQAISAQIREIRSELAEVESIDAIRFVESRAAKVYWKAWRTVLSKFPTKDQHLVPDHWCRFDSRISPLSGASPRLAANPVNAILNYLYALLEAECRLAVATLGLDPEMGMLHMDTSNRASLACDLMEPIRPDVDAYVLRWILHQPLKRNWFFEERNGNCRLMADLASQLTQTTSTWARLVAPIAEWAVKEIASTTKTRRSIPATRLTQNHKRSLTGRVFSPEAKNLLRLQNMCNACGNEIQNESEQCRVCAQEASAHRLMTAASKGRVVSHSSTAQAKRSKTRKANHAALREWSASDQPAWLTEEFYAQKIRPLLFPLSSRSIARQLKVSRGYANEIRHGRMPHQRHWQTLARLTGLEVYNLPKVR
jgi:CRISPR/Cas system-associated endonuclease Cas1